MPNGGVPARRGWWEDEPPLARTGWKTGLRLIRRACASWPVWVATVMLIGTIAVVARVRNPPPYATTVVLRLAEGILASSREPLSSGALRGYIEDLAFSRANLLAIAQRHPDAFPNLAQEPADAVAHLQAATTLTISENDFVEYRQKSDPPRAVKIEIAFRSGQPDLSWAVAQELADLLTGAEVARQQRSAQRRAAAAELESRSVESRAGAARPSKPGSPESEGLRTRTESALRKGVEARWALRALQEHQALRFDVVDPGRRPVRKQGIEAITASFLVGLLLLGVAAMLIAGAFDPRVLDASDLRTMDIDVLGGVRDRV